MTLPPGMMWPSWEWWCHLKAADQGAWASAIATAAAALLALWLGVRDGIRRHFERTERGRIALALSLPELARIKVILDEIIVCLDVVIDGVRSDPDSRFETHPGHAILVSQTVLCDALTKKLHTSLSAHAIDHYVGMPRKLKFNIPTAVQSLPYMHDIAAQIHRALKKHDAEATLNLVQMHRDFVSHTRIDFDAAVTHIERHIVPDQLKNMGQKIEAMNR